MWFCPLKTSLNTFQACWQYLLKIPIATEILKELTTVRSNTTQWSTQSATKMEQLTNDVAFTPTALSATRPSRNSGTKNKGIATLKPILGYDLGL